MAVSCYCYLVPAEMCKRVECTATLFIIYLYGIARLTLWPKTAQLLQLNVLPAELHLQLSIATMHAIGTSDPYHGCLDR